jgi:hypothetical protein
MLKTYLDKKWCMRFNLFSYCIPNGHPHDLFGWLHSPKKKLVPKNLFGSLGVIGNMTRNKIENAVNQKGSN